MKGRRKRRRVRKRKPTKRPSGAQLTRIRLLEEAAMMMGPTLDSAPADALLLVYLDGGTTRALVIRRSRLHTDPDFHELVREPLARLEAMAVPVPADAIPAIALHEGATSGYVLRREPELRITSPGGCA